MGTIAIARLSVVRPFRAGAIGTRTVLKTRPVLAGPILTGLVGAWAVVARFITITLPLGTWSASVCIWAFGAVTVIAVWSCAVEARTLGARTILTVAFRTRSVVARLVAAWTVKTRP